MDEDTPVESPAEGPVSLIQIQFHVGPHTTPITLQTSYVDAAQIELAGRFLVRQAEKMYRQAEQQQNQRSPIVIAPAGSIPNA